MAWIILGIIVSYLVGSLPTAYLFGRILRGIDIRKFGSGNVGATNAFRVLGKTTGIVVLLLDIFKGFLPVVFLADWILFKDINISPQLLRIILGFTCISGHNWTIFLGFKGGKGIATSFGVLLGLAMKISSLRMILAFLILTWLAVFIITRIVSLASILTAIALPIYMLCFREQLSLIILSIVLSAFVILRHRSNLKRILQGKESRLK